MTADDIWGRMFNFANYGELVALVQNSIVAAAVLGIVGGLIGVFVMQRDMAFAVHGISELSFAGAAGALLIGANVVLGSLVGSLLAAILMAVVVGLCNLILGYHWLTEVLAGWLLGTLLVITAANQLRGLPRPVPSPSVNEQSAASAGMTDGTVTRTETSYVCVTSARIANNASRTRAAVGRVVAPAGVDKGRPRNSPATMRITWFRSCSTFDGASSVARRLCG